MELPNGEQVIFWSGKYGKYHDARSQLRFVDRSALLKRYDVEIVLQFANAVPASVNIKPYVNTPVI